jgi:hypothetical protein
MRKVWAYIELYSIVDYNIIPFSPGARFETVIHPSVEFADSSSYFAVISSGSGWTHAIAEKSGFLD